MSISEKLLGIRQLGKTAALLFSWSAGWHYESWFRSGDRERAKETTCDHSRRILEGLKVAFEAHGLEHLVGLENYCVVSTHSSLLDPLALYATLPEPVRFIAKRELTAVPFIGGFLKLYGVLIDRKRGISAKDAIANAIADDNQWPILIFAEGTRSKDGEIAPFKTGGLTVLADAGLALVPVCIKGSYEAFSRHAKSVTPGTTIKIHIGPPVMPGDDTPERIATVEQRVHELADR